MVIFFKLTCYGKHFNLNIFLKTVQRDFINNIYRYICQIQLKKTRAMKA